MGLEDSSFYKFPALSVATVCGAKMYVDVTSRGRPSSRKAHGFMNSLHNSSLLLLGETGKNTDCISRCFSIVLIFIVCSLVC